MCHLTVYERNLEGVLHAFLSLPSGSPVDCTPDLHFVIYMPLLSNFTAPALIQAPTTTEIASKLVYLLPFLALLQPNINNKNKDKNKNPFIMLSMPGTFLNAFILTHLIQTLVVDKSTT